MTAIDQLIELHERTKRAKYPNVPEKALPKSTFNDTTANGLTACILQWLSLNGHWATRINTTGRWIKGETVVDAIGRTREMKGMYIPGSTKKGTADIHAVINGTHVSIEVKIGKDKMSERQTQIKEQIEKSGGIFWIAKTFESFLQKYNDLKNHNSGSPAGQGVGSFFLETKQHQIINTYEYRNIR